MADWTPADITTALWLDASDESTITLDGNNNVSQWDDKSGNGKHCSQATIDCRPAYTEASVNGLNVVDWGSGANNNYMSNGAGINLQDTFIVVVWDADTSVFTQYNGLICGGGTNEYLTGFWHDADWCTKWGLSQDLYHNGAPARPHPLGDYVRWYAFPEVKSVSIWNLSSPNAINLSGYVLGRDRYAGREWYGRICEIIVLDSQADTDTRQRIEGYLAHKWGLESELPIDHPYVDNPPTAPDPETLFPSPFSVTIGGDVTHDTAPQNALDPLSVQTGGSLWDEYDTITVLEPVSVTAGGSLRVPVSYNDSIEDSFGLGDDPTYTTNFSETYLAPASVTAGGEVLIPSHYWEEISDTFELTEELILSTGFAEISLSPLSLTASGSISAPHIFYDTLADDIEAADDPERIILLLPSCDDSVEMLDGLGCAWPKTVESESSIEDTLSPSVHIIVDGADAIEADDSIANFLMVITDVSESIDLGEEITELCPMLGNCHDTAQIWCQVGWGWGKGVASALQLGDTPSAILATLVQESVWIRDAIETLWKGSRSLSDLINILDTATILRLVDEIVTSEASAEDSIDLILAVIASDTALMTDVVSSLWKGDVILSDVIHALDASSLARVFEEILTSEANIADVAAAVIAVLVQDTALCQETLSSLWKGTRDVNELINLLDHPSLGRVFQDLVTSEATATDALQVITAIIASDTALFQEEVSPAWKGTVEASELVNLLDDASLGRIIYDLVTSEATAEDTIQAIAAVIASDTALFQETLSSLCKGSGDIIELLHSVDNASLGRILDELVTSESLMEDVINSIVSVLVQDTTLCRDTLTSLWKGTRSISEGLHALDRSTLERILQTIVESGMTAEESVEAIYGALVQDTFYIKDIIAGNCHVLRALSEILYFFDTVDTAKIYYELTQESAALDDSARLAFCMKLIDALTITGIASNIGEFQHSLLESLSATDDISRGFDLRISEQAAAGDTLALRFLAIVALSDTVKFTDVSSQRLSVSESVEDTIHLSPAVALQQILTAVIEDGMGLEVALEIEGGEGEQWECWVLNTSQAFPSVYSGFAFNSFCEHDGQTYAARSDGIYRLIGDTDAGTAIKTGIVLPETTFGVYREKRFRKAAFGISGTAPAVRIETESGAKTYLVQNARTIFSREQMGRKFTIKVSDFDDLDFIEIVPVILSS